MAFHRATNIPIAIDRENFGEATHSHGIKNVLSSARKHAGPKQAFGELKNVLHNQQQNFFTPLKTTNNSSNHLSLKKNSISTPFKTSTNTANLQSSKKPQTKDSNAIKSASKEKEKQQKISKKLNKFVKNPIDESNHPLCLWAQKIALTDSELHHIFNQNDDEFEIPEIPPVSVEPFPEIWKDQLEVDFFSTDFNNNNNEIVRVPTPILSDDSLENVLLDELLAF